MHAPPKPTDIPVLNDPSQLYEYDAFLFGIPTRYGNFPGQWKAFWDKAGGAWQAGAYWGKYAGLFVSTAGLGGGQESTAIAAMSTLAHHGIIYVPLGYKPVFGMSISTIFIELLNILTLSVGELINLDEVHGGSPWGAGTFASSTGQRQPTPLELKIAQAQGKAFYETVAKAFP